MENWLSPDLGWEMCEMSLEHLVMPHSKKSHKKLLELLLKLKKCPQAKNDLSFYKDNICNRLKHIKYA